MLAVLSYSGRVQSCRKNHLSMKLRFLGVLELMGVLLTAETWFAPAGLHHSQEMYWNFFCLPVSISRAHKTKGLWSEAGLSLDTVLRGTCSGLWKYFNFNLFSKYKKNINILMNI